MLDRVEADADARIQSIDKELVDLKEQSAELINDLMKKDQDIFAPCLKPKNKVILHQNKDSKASRLLKDSEVASTEEKLKELIHTKLREEHNLKELPNFTCQVDFALQRTT